MNTLLKSMLCMCMMFISGVTTAVYARENVLAVFGDPISKSRGVTSVEIEGSTLSAYDISLLKCMILEKEATGHTAAIEKALTADSPAAAERDVRRSGGRIVYGFYAFGPTKDNRKFGYVYYVSSPEQAALIYFESKLPPSEVREKVLSKLTSGNL